MADKPTEHPAAYLVRDKSIVYELAPHSVLNIGRLDTNDVVLDDYKVSREHALLKYSEGKFTLIDLASTHGTFINGKWEGQGASKTEIPSDKLIIELLENKPTMLLLDEFQTWYDGLTNTQQYPWRNWAFNFIQLLSEIANDHPDLLILVASIRDNQSQAYQQIHRINPLLVDFQSNQAKQDRLRLLLYRIFQNRLNVPSDQNQQSTNSPALMAAGGLPTLHHP